jgi:NAD(P)-dependent dehydrogenase (short-subunit alcohol dehydrogenase family)
MAQKLTGKSAVVTGAGSAFGIGRSVALALAAEGAKVVVNDVFKDPDGTPGADRVVREIVKANGIAIANYDSVSTISGGEKIIKSAVNNFGRIDILVNCAGNLGTTLLEDVTEENWDSVMNVHLKGHLACTKAAIPEMIKQKSGRIICFSSRGAFLSPNMPKPDASKPIGAVSNPAYSTAKAGIMGFAWYLAAQLDSYGITVNAILPSATTPLFPMTAPRGGDVPDSLSLDPDFIPPIIVYLSTDEARSINGQFIYASGGDICFYGRPLEPRTFIRKSGKWTVDELTKIIPPLRIR